MNELRHIIADSRYAEWRKELDAIFLPERRIEDPVEIIDSLCANVPCPQRQALTNDSQKWVFRELK